MEPGTTSVRVFLLMLLITAQGIRTLVPVPVSPDQQQIKERNQMEMGKADSSTTEAENFMCKDGGFPGRGSRQLATAQGPSPSENTKDEGIDQVEAQRDYKANTAKASDTSSENLSGLVPDSSYWEPTSKTYPDIIDIPVMDYTPAKRKPPIHN